VANHSPGLVDARDAVVVDALTRRVAEEQRKESSDAAVGNACL
jgi:hypothetical protein